MKPKLSRSRYRYGDFPQLFWDARKEARIDVADPVTLARLLTRADARTVGLLVPQELLREQLEALPIPEPTRIFWRNVLAHVPQRDGEMPGSSP